MKPARQPRDGIPKSSRRSDTQPMRHLGSRIGRQFACRLVVMVKEPKAGRVKTRLGRDIGTVAATYFYRHAATAVIRRLSAASRWRTILAVAPDASLASRFWPHQLERLPQGAGDLGRRMQKIMDWRCAGPIIIVGTDIPAIQPSHIGRAFRALTASDAVLGPTPDGGYWLVGLRRCPRILQPFQRVRWSSEHALADTVAKLQNANLAIADELADVDDGEYWRRATSCSGRVVLPLATRGLED